MNWEAKQITKNDEDVVKIKTLMKTAFPKNEQIPMWILLKGIKSKDMSIIGFYDNNSFVGFTYIILDSDITFILFLAIDPLVRSKGYGSKILAYIKAQYPDTRLVLQMQAMDETKDNYQQRLQRQKFYFNNGYENVGYKFDIHGEVSEVLVNGNSSVTKKEYYHLFNKLFGTMIMWFLHPKFIDM